MENSNKIEWALKTINQYVNNGEITKENLNRLEVLFAFKYLENTNIRIDDGGKLCVLQ